MQARFSRLVLASASPRRRELLAQLDVSFETLAADIDETKHAKENVEDYVLRMAQSKARAVFSREPASLRANTVYLAGDTIVALENRVFGKPADKDEAMTMLRALSGREHQVYSGLALIAQHSQWPAPAILSCSTVTQVQFRELSEQDINRYCQTGEPMDKAGAYAIQGGAAAFVISIHGSYSGVVGLPLSQTIDLFSEYRDRFRAIFDFGAGLSFC